MCGLVGLSAGPERLSGTEEVMFAQLLSTAHLRGDDSTGMISIQEPTTKIEKKIAKGTLPNIPFKMLKSAEAPYKFLARDEVHKLIRVETKGTMMGHTRAATTGSISTPNAHPFDFPSVIGMMNGTVPRTYIENGFKFETDSEGIFKMIDGLGPEKAFEELSGQPNAPMALVYFNKKLNTLEIFRNNSNNQGRPLVLALASDKKTLLWASESYMLMWITRRNNYTLSDEWKYAWPTEKKIFRYHLYDPDFIQKVEVIPITPKPRPFVYELYQHGPPHGSQKGRSLVPATPTYGENAAGSHTSDSTASGTKSYKAGSLPVVSWQDGSEDATDRGDTADSTMPDMPDWLVRQADEPQKVLPNVGMTTAEWDEMVAVNDAMRKDVKAKEKAIAKAMKKAQDSNQEEVDVSDFAETRRGYRGVYTTRRNFEARLTSGCCVCGEHFDLKEPFLDMHIGWTNTDAGPEPICPTCLDNHADLVEQFGDIDDARKDTKQ